MTTGMDKTELSLKCYVAAYHNSDLDRKLKENGFTTGMIGFAIPDLGILFRCRTEGNLVDLEFAAFFALLRFIRTRLSQVKIKSVQVLSSLPEFVFSFNGKSPHLANNEERKKLLVEYGKSLGLAVGYIKVINNAALISTADAPSLPSQHQIVLQPDPSEKKTSEFRPFDTGLHL